MFTRLGLILLAICAFGAFCVLSNDDYKEAKKAAGPIAKHIETNAEYHARIDKVKQYVLEKQMEVLLTDGLDKNK